MEWHAYCPLVQANKNSSPTSALGGIFQGLIQVPQDPSGKRGIKGLGGPPQDSDPEDPLSQRKTLLWRKPDMAGFDDADTCLLGVDAASRAPLFVNLRNAKVDPAELTKDGAELLEARGALMNPHMDTDMAARACHAYTLATWHESTAFCGFCGSPTKANKCGAERKCLSEACGKPTYPRTNPVAIMAIISPDGSKMLLGQTRIRHKANMYSTLAGFIDQAESLEDAVRREAFEEGGVRIGDVAYHSSQPWPFPGNLMLGCFCRAVTEDVRVDKEEMADVRWFGAEEVREALAAWPDGKIVLPPKTAIAHHLIQHWLDDIAPNTPTITGTAADGDAAPPSRL